MKISAPEPVGISTVKNAPKSLRLFFALWPDAAVSEQLQALQASIHGRKTHHADFHITLAFMGNRDPALLSALEQIVKALPEERTSLLIDRLGYFPKKRIAWAGMTEPPPELFRRQRQLVHALAGQSIPFADHGAYRPHITLARGADAPPEQPFTPIAWHAGRIVLARSLTGADGPKYQILV